MIHHELFTMATIHNDIALVKIDGTLDFKQQHSFLEPICLAVSGQNLPLSCVATGFGYRNARKFSTEYGF